MQLICLYIHGMKILFLFSKFSLQVIYIDVQDHYKIQIF